MLFEAESMGPGLWLRQNRDDSRGMARGWVSGLGVRQTGSHEIYGAVCGMARVAALNTPHRRHPGFRQGRKTGTPSVDTRMRSETATLSEVMPSRRWGPGLWLHQNRDDICSLNSGQPRNPGICHPNRIVPARTMKADANPMTPATTRACPFQMESSEMDKQARSHMFRA